MWAIDRIPRSLWADEDADRVHLSLSGTPLETLASPGFQRRAYGIVDCGSRLWYLQNTKIIRILGTGCYLPVLPLIPRAAKAGLSYVEIIPRDYQVPLPSGAVIRADQAVADAVFERRSCGNGSKGPRYSDWAMTATGIKGQYLLIRRLISRPDQNGQGRARLGPDPGPELERHLPPHRPGRPRPAPVGFQNSATGPDLAFYAARSYSLMRPPRTGRRLIRLRERSATGWSGRGGRSWRLR